MFRGQARNVALAACLVVALALMSGCAKREVLTGGNSPGPTSVRIERTYTLLNAPPFQMTGNAASAQKLYAALQALSPDSGQTVCPGDAGVHYTITITDGSKQLTKATAIYGGCRVVLMNDHSYTGTGAAGKTFWSALFDAVGPDGQPNAGSGSPPGSAS